MLRRRSAAAANDVEPSVTSELTQDFRGFIGGLVVAAEGIRQPRVWMAAQVNRRDLGKFLDIGPHLFAAQSAVDANRKKTCVRYRVPKGFNGLARKRAAAVIGDRDGSHHRYPAPCFRKIFLESEKRSLRIESIEDRFGEQHIGPAVDQTTCLLVIGSDERVKRGGTERGIINIR